MKINISNQASKDSNTFVFESSRPKIRRNQVCHARIVVYVHAINSRLSIAASYENNVLRLKSTPNLINI